MPSRPPTRNPAATPSDTSNVPAVLWAAPGGSQNPSPTKTAKGAAKASGEASASSLMLWLERPVIRSLSRRAARAGPRRASSHPAAPGRAARRETGHTPGDGGLVDLLGRGARDDQGADRLVDLQDLVDGAAAGVALDVALLAAHGAPELRAGERQPETSLFSGVGCWGRRQCGQSMRTSRWATTAVHGRCHGVLVDAHLGEPDEGAGGAVGVHGRDDDVPRHAGLDGDPAGLEIAHLADMITSGS